MGQRHQIYIRLPKINFGESNRNNRNAKTIGFHHQWLYGATALEVLDNFLSIYDKHIQDKYACLSERGDHGIAETLIEHVLSVLPNSGSYERLHKLTGTSEVNNPHYGDNNDGITIIDIEKPRDVRYAFASLGYTEGRLPLPEGLYSAREYLSSYYCESEWENVSGRNQKDIHQVLRRLDTVHLIDKERLKEIFPEWASDQQDAEENPNHSNSS